MESDKNPNLWETGQHNLTLTAIPEERESTHSRSYILPAGLTWNTKSGGTASFGARDMAGVVPVWCFVAWGAAGPRHAIRRWTGTVR